MKRMLLAFAAFLLAPLAVPAAPPNADRTAPPPELQLMLESILKEAATDLKLAVYPPRFESAVTAFGEFPSWILPVGNFNEAPPTRSHFGSLQFMCEGWIVFLDGVDWERLSDIPVLSEHSDAIDIYRVGSMRVVLAPFKNPEQDVWREFASRIAEKRKSLSPAPSFDDEPVALGKRFEDLFPKTDKKAFETFGEQFRDALAKKLPAGFATISPPRLLSRGHAAGGKHPFPAEFRAVFPRLAIKARIGSTTLKEWEDPELQDTTGVFWILPLSDPKTGRPHEINQPILDVDEHHVVHHHGYVRIDGETPPEAIRPLVFVGSARDYRVFLLPYNETNRVAWGRLSDAARQVLVELDAPGDEAPSVRNKLEAIRIPFAEWSNADVRDVLDALTEASRDFDENEPDSSKRGVAFVLANDIEEADEIPLVTLKGSDISLGSLLDKISETTGLAYQIEGRRILLRPKTAQP
jgi:hypothetical protein